MYCRFFIVFGRVSYEIIYKCNTVILSAFHYLEELYNLINLIHTLFLFHTLYLVCFFKLWIAFKMLINFNSNVEIDFQN